MSSDIHKNKKIFDVSDCPQGKPEGRNGIR